MRTITKISTELSEEVVYQRFHFLLVNNRYSVFPGKQEWAWGSRFFCYKLENGVVTIESWIHDVLAGDMSIEGRMPNVTKNQMREVLAVIINAIKTPNSEVTGFNPVIKGKLKASSNYETLERAEKAAKVTSTNIALTWTSLGFSVINWIIMLAAEMIYFYLPIMSILLAAGAIKGNGNAKKRGEGSSGLVITLSIISIILSGIALLTFVLQYL